VFKSENASVGFIKARVGKGTVVHTDEAKGWEALRAKYAMKVINHSQAYSADDACTNQTESFFSRLRRAEFGQHHHISGLYLARYAGKSHGGKITAVSRTVRCSAWSASLPGPWECRWISRNTGSAGRRLERAQSA
jgi:hypothetical protein